MSGWASNSKYAFLGALRSTAQMISYEVSMVLLLLPVILLTGSASLTEIVEAQESLSNIIILLPGAGLFYISLLAETNRLPFDLPEAESELVSGYNVEYSSITFAFFFLAEYTSIILMSVVFVILFLGGWSSKFFIIYVISIMISFVLIRGTLPRYRFDQLITLG
jgi:NADH-quinone oxidoreductase subunit H